MQGLPLFLHVPPSMPTASICRQLQDVAALHGCWGLQLCTCMARYHSSCPTALYEVPTGRCACAEGLPPKQAEHLLHMLSLLPGRVRQQSNSLSCTQVVVHPGQTELHGASQGQSACTEPCHPPQAHLGYGVQFAQIHLQVLFVQHGEGAL